MYDCRTNLSVRAAMLTVAILFYLTPVQSQVQTPCTELFISEYIEGSSFNKCIEIFNGTGSAVDLSSYSIEIYFNGNNSPQSTINLSGSVDAGDVYVVCHSSAGSGFLAESDIVSGSLNYNGDDAVVLLNGMVTLDVIGQIGTDPGSEWGSGSTSTANNTIRRKSNINMGDANGSDAFNPSVEWDGFAQNNMDDLGSHTSDECDPCGDLGLVVMATATETEICEGENIELFESGDDNQVISWEWTGPNGWTSTDENPIISAATANASGTYTVIGYEESLGCSEMATIDIIVNEFPVAPVVEDLAVCTEEETLVDLSELIGPATTSVIRFLDFESPGGYTTSVAEFSDGFGDYFTRTDGSNIGSFVNFSNMDGMFFFAGQDVDGEGAIEPLFFYLDDINVTGQSNLALSILLAEDQSSDGNEDWDNSDEFLIDYRIDNGSWTPLLHVQNDGSTFNSAPYIDTDFDGTGDGQEITDVFTEYIVKIPDVGNSIDIRITIDLAAGDEDIAFDNLKVGSYIPAVSSFNFYDQDPVGGMVEPVAEMVSSYEPGASGIYYVSALSGDCEGPATEFEIILSQGYQPLNCNDHLNLSLGADCTLEVTPQMMLEGEGVMFEFVSVELVDENGYVVPNATLDISHVGQTFKASIIDDCNGNSCWGTVSLEDKLPPLIEAPDVRVDCGTDISVEALNNITLTDCSYASFETYDEEFGDLCEDNSYIARTIIAMDEYGNTAYHVQYIYFNALDLGDITPPNQIVTTTCGVISMPDIYDYTGNILDAYPLLNGEPLYPGEHCNILVAKKDNIVEACDLSCSNSVKVVRLWKIYDWCNIEEPIYFEQVISAKDIEAPIIYPYPELDSFNVDPWTCAVEDLTLPLPYITDNCTPEAVDVTIYGPSGIEIVDGVAKNVPLGEHEFVYYASDCCGNVSDPQIITVAVIDEVIPVAIALQEINLSLTYDVEDDDGIGKLYAESVDNGSYDMCGPVTLRIRRESDPCRADSDEYGPFVKFCCRDVGKTFKVWLEVRDTSGNYNETWANVLVEDKFAVIECTDIYLECDDDIDDAISDNRPDAYGTCRSKRVTELYRDYSYYDETCNSGVIYVTWGVRDLEHIRCTQAVYVNYEASLVCDDIHWPESYKETDCMDLEPVDLTWDANPCDLIGWTVRSDTFSFESGACAKIINEYTVIDWCQFDYFYGNSLGSGYGYPGNYFEFEGGNDYFDGELCADPNPPYYHYDDSFSENGVYKYVEVIKLVDDIRPEILLCDYDPFTITSDCARTVTLSNIGQDNSGCPNTLLSWDLWVTLEDGRLYNYTARSKPGEVVNIDLVDDDGDPLWFYGPMSTHTARWILSDGCGNVDKCETAFMVVDRKDPTPYCVHLSSAVMENGQVEIWAKDFDIGSFDNCSIYDSLRFTFDGIAPDLDLLFEEHYFDGGGVVESDIADRYASGEIQKWDPYSRSSARVFTCSDLPSSTFGMSVWDEKLNTDYCEVTLDLVDNQDACEGAQLADIIGSIRMKDGNGIGNVDINLDNLTTGEQLTTVTDLEGVFAFNSLPLAEDYEITPSKKGEITNGLTTEDVLIIQKYIMDESVFTSPYDIIASDLNNDKRISATDIILLQRIIIGQLTELKDGIWKFVDAAQELTSENALADYRSNFAVASLGGGITTSDFIGVKMGDVTGDASANLRNGEGGSRTLNQSVVQIVDRYVSKGELIEIPVLIPDYKDLVGYQMTINAVDGEIIDVSSASTDLYASNVGYVADDMVAISYAGYSTEVTSDHIFTIVFKANRSSNLSDLIDINNEFINSEIYHGTEVSTSGLDLQFINPEQAGAFIVNQNTPNPFSNETSIQFILPKDGQVSLNVYNVSGQLTHSTTGHYVKGINTIKLDRFSLNQSNGVLYYKMIFDNQSVTRKMIIIE